MNKVVVHIIRMGDVEDPDLMVADPIWKWQQTDAGKWVMEHSTETPMWQRHVDINSFGYRYDIVAYLEGADLTYWKLKYE
jgi:hypothetical protein